MKKPVLSFYAGKHHVSSKDTNFQESSFDKLERLSIDKTMKEPLSKKYANLIARARKEIKINAKNLTDQIKGESERLAKPFPPKRET